MATRDDTEDICGVGATGVEPTKEHPSWLQKEAARRIRRGSSRLTGGMLMDANLIANLPAGQKTPLAHRRIASSWMPTLCVWEH